MEEKLLEKYNKIDQLREEIKVLEEKLAKKNDELERVVNTKIKINGKLFIDPWNLVRVSRDYDVKMDRFDVNFTILELGEKLKAYDVGVPHKSFREAFIEDFVNMLQMKKKDVFSFFENIDIEKAIEETESDEQLIDTLVKDAGISEAGKQKAVKYLNGEI